LCRKCSKNGDHIPWHSDDFSKAFPAGDVVAAIDEAVVFTSSGFSLNQGYRVLVFGLVFDATFALVSETCFLLTFKQAAS